MKVGRYTLSNTKKGCKVKIDNIEIGLIPNTKAEELDEDALDYLYDSKVTDFEGLTNEDFLWCD